MRSFLRTALALSSAGVVLAACSDQPASAPTAPGVLRSLPARAQPLVVAATCDPNGLKAIYRDYATKPNDVGLSIIGDIPGALKADAAVSGGPVPGASATNKVLDAFARIALIRGTTDMNPAVTGQTFDNLVRGLLKCARTELYAGAPEPDAPGGPGFRPAVGKFWELEVVGPGLSNAVFERGSKETDDTFWALYPKTGAWGTSIVSPLTGNRAIAYGYRKSFLQSNAKIGSSFENRFLPAAPGLAKGILLFCAGTSSPVTVGNQAKINHANKFLAEVANPPSCTPGPPSFTPTTGTLAFGRQLPLQLAQRAASYFWPQPLYAATMFGGGSVTGSPDDFSPSAVIDLSQVTPKYNDVHIADTFVGQPLKTITGADVRAQVLSSDNKAIPGVTVEFFIVGNSSNIAFFNDGGTEKASVLRTTSTESAPGAEDWFATLDAPLTKTGQHQIGVRVFFDGVVGTVVSTNKFNSKPAP